MESVDYVQFKYKKAVAKQLQVKRQFNLETWMTDLPNNQRSRAIGKLVIPGSHHSLTYSVDAESPVAGDFVLRVNGVFWNIICKMFTKKIVAKLSKTQSVSITQQLASGVRYFDIRVQYDKDSELMWTVHLMKAQLLSQGLSEINHFLVSHPGEVVFLDFQHFVNFQNSQSHSRLKLLLQATFEQRLCPRNFQPFTMLSLDSMFQMKYQVIVIYRDFDHELDYFPSCYFPIVYGSYSSMSLLRSAVNHISLPWPERWWLIMHMIIRPEKSRAFKRLLSDSHYCARAALQQTKSFVEYLKGCLSRPTFIVADFVDLRDSEFPKMIVSLNYSEPQVERKISHQTKKRKTPVIHPESSSHETFRGTSSM